MKNVFGARRRIDRRRRPQRAWLRAESLEPRRTLDGAAGELFAETSEGADELVVAYLDAPTDIGNCGGWSAEWKRIPLEDFGIQLTPENQSGDALESGETLEKVIADSDRAYDPQIASTDEMTMDVTESPVDATEFLDEKVDDDLAFDSSSPCAWRMQSMVMLETTDGGEEQFLDDEIAATAFMTNDMSSSDGRWHNAAEPLDADGDGYVSPIDMLAVVNAMSTVGVGRLQGEAEAAIGGVQLRVDIDNDGFLAPSDALQLVNFLNSDDYASTVASESAAAQFAAETSESSRLAFWEGDSSADDSGADALLGDEKQDAPYWLIDDSAAGNADDSRLALEDHDRALEEVLDDWLTVV